MDVNTISNAAAQNIGQFTAQKNSAAKVQNAVGAYAKNAKTETAKDSANAAFSVDISDAAKQAQSQENIVQPVANPQNEEKIKQLIKE